MVCTSEKVKSTSFCKSKIPSIVQKKLTFNRKIEIKKKREGDKRFKVVGTKTTFKTANKELLKKVREQFPEEKNKKKKEDEEKEENEEIEAIEEGQSQEPEKPTDPFKEKGGFLLKIKSEKSMEYGIQLIEGDSANAELGRVLYTAGSSISTGQEKIYTFDYGVIGECKHFTVWFVSTIDGQKHNCKWWLFFKLIRIDSLEVEDVDGEPIDEKKV